MGGAKIWSILVLFALVGCVFALNTTCQADCTFGDNICHASCSGINNCTNFLPACNNVTKNGNICSNSSGGTAGTINCQTSCCNRMIVCCGQLQYCGSGTCTMPLTGSATGNCCTNCPSGYANCNQNSADGCEVNLNTNNNNCGSCGHACAVGQTCSAGSCISAPACNSDCTSGGVCNPSCSGVNGCTNYLSSCNNRSNTATICMNSYQYAKCCNGAATSCSVNSTSCNSYCSGNSRCAYPSNPATCQTTCVSGNCQACTPSCGSAGCSSCGTTSCPAKYCSGNSLCTYSSTCANTCSGGSCKACSCTATCTACASGTTCNGGACVSSGGGSPLLRKCGPLGCMAEPTEQPQLTSTWTVGVVLIAIIGLVVGYFILRQALFSVAVRKPRKK